MLKYKGIVLKHWQLLKNHEDFRKQKMAAALHFLYSSRLALSLGTLERFYGRSVRKIQVKKT